MNKKPRLAIPKGSLFNSFQKYSNLCGYDMNIYPRSYNININHLSNTVDCWLAKPSEIPLAIYEGVYAYGLTGLDCLVEANLEDKLHINDKLIFSKASNKTAWWVVAVDKNSSIKSIYDLKNKKIATEKPNILKKYFDSKNIPIEIVHSVGATESKIKLGICDAICDIVETGESLQAQNLHVICGILETYPVLISKHKETYVDEIFQYFDAIKNVIKNSNKVKIEFIVANSNIYNPVIYKGLFFTDGHYFTGLYDESDIAEIVRISTSYIITETRTSKLEHIYNKK